ncbi:cupin domain-containing protein [Trinickia sp. EG282A]|uniref:cupin domain-containing protein n=1 Tax=Trinickia sp. EG282A TaxID=3237013 RepID=UPI0034D38067
MENGSSGMQASLVVVHPDREIATTQRLPYFVGISADTVGSKNLSMHLVVVPPGGQAEPHVHVGYETGIYVLEGRVETRYGPGLRESVVTEAGDFLFVPPGVPHQPVNLSDTMPARAIVARNMAEENDRVEPYDPVAER